MIQPQINIDPNNVRDIQRAFTQLNAREQKNVFRSALRQSSTILRKETVKNLRQTNVHITPKMIKGVKIKVLIRNGEYYSKVHIMGEYRLKFIEDGTVGRYTTGRKRMRRGIYRGKITQKKFFASARSSKEREIFDNIESRIRKNIIRIWQRRP